MTDPAPEYEIHPEHTDPDGPALAVRDEDDDPLSLVGDDLDDEEDE